MSQTSPSRPFARPRVSVPHDDTAPPAMPSPGRMIDTLTPKTRKVSRLPQAERSYALELACRCVEEAYQARDGPAFAHAAHLRTDGYKTLKRALCMKDDTRTVKDILEHSGEDSITSASESDALSDTAATSGCSPAKQRRSTAIWRSMGRLGLSSAGAGGPKGPSPFKASPSKSATGPNPVKGLPPPSPQSEGPRRKTSASAARSASITADTRTCYSDVAPYSSRLESSAQKALDALFLAAPVKGEVQPWVWLLRTVADAHALDCVHDSICYLAKIVRYIAAEEEWLRLLVHELTPVIEHLHADELPLNAVRALGKVADKALQLGQAALCNYRSHSSSQCKNAALLHCAVRLISLLTSCGHKADDSSLSEFIQTKLTEAAHERYRSLKASIGKPRGQALSPGTRPSAAEEAVQGQLAVTDQLHMDVSQDEEVYQQAFPSNSPICLATISCRVFCQLLRPDLDRVLAQQPPARGPLLGLFHAVHQMERKAQRFFSSALGPHGVFVDETQRPLFLQYIDEYLRAVQDKLIQWTARALDQEKWECSGTPVMCTASLVDSYAAMTDAAEEHGALAAVHPSYAAMLERVLVEVAHQHVTKLEAFAQALFPVAPSPSKRTLTRAQQQQQPEPWLPGRELCAMLSDMREARQKQADAAEALRVCVPRAWWGAEVGSGQSRLGSRLQIMQGHTERRYVVLLTQTVAWMMTSIAPVLGYALEAGAAELPTQAAAYPGHRLAAVESALYHRIEHLRPLMDPRVLRRVAKDLWNSCAGSLADRLLSTQASQGVAGSPHADSLGDVGPRMQSGEALRKGLAEWFVCKADVNLRDADEPEKARKLAKLVGAFLHLGDGGATDSLDA